MEPKSNFNQLWNHVCALNAGKSRSVHGPDHWKRVERNGLLLATRTGANTDVVQLFAMFHDSQRLNDGTDPDHGRRGAMLAHSLRGTLLHISDPLFELLDYACTWHTDQTHHTDATIATCWDADRLDLGRVGMIPNAKYMSTDFGKEIAKSGVLHPFLTPPKVK